MYYDALDRVESSIPDTSNMYNHWSTSCIMVGTGYSGGAVKTVKFPATPQYIVVAGDLYSLYQFPSSSSTSGLYVNFSSYGTSLTLTETDMMAQGFRYTFDIDIWY